MKKDGKSKKRKVRFPGVSEMARELGCTKAHLWLVLAGRRSSASLSRRIAELKHA